MLQFHEFFNILKKIREIPTYELIFCRLSFFENFVKIIHVAISRNLNYF